MINAHETPLSFLDRSDTNLVFSGSFNRWNFVGFGKGNRLGQFFPSVSAVNASFRVVEWNKANLRSGRVGAEPVVTLCGIDE